MTTYRVVPGWVNADGATAIREETEVESKARFREINAEHANWHVSQAIDYLQRLANSSTGKDAEIALGTAGQLTKLKAATSMLLKEASDQAQIEHEKGESEWIAKAEQSTYYQRLTKEEE